MTVSAGIVAATPVVEQHVNAGVPLRSDVLYRTIDRDRVTHIGLNKLGDLEVGFDIQAVMWSAPAIFSRSTKQAPIPEYAPVTTTLFPAKLINESILVSSSDLNSAKKY